jgi:ABC-type Na+ efflux pump permease subunit
MTLRRSIIVAKTDLKMAMKLSYVKYGLIAMSALGPVMILAIVGFVTFNSPSTTELLAMLSLLNPTISPMLGVISLIPASLIAANALVGEREQNTMEALLCTPLTDSELLTGKVLSSVIPSMLLLIGTIAVTEIGSIAIFISAGLPLSIHLLIPDLSGLFLLLSAGPTMILAISSVMILISGRVTRVYEAYQVSGGAVMIFILPMIVPLLVMQSGIPDASLVWLSDLATILLAAVLMVVTWFLAIGRFNRDRLVTLV